MSVEAPDVEQAEQAADVRPRKAPKSHRAYRGRALAFVGLLGIAGGAYAGYEASGLTAVQHAKDQAKAAEEAGTAATEAATNKGIEQALALADGIIVTVSEQNGRFIARDPNQRLAGCLTFLVKNPFSSVTPATSDSQSIHLEAQTKVSTTQTNALNPNAVVGGSQDVIPTEIYSQTDYQHFAAQEETNRQFACGDPQPGSPPPTP